MKYTFGESLFETAAFTTRHKPYVAIRTNGEKVKVEWHDMALIIVITDSHTLFIALLGIVLSIGYILVQALRPYNTPKDIEEEQKNITEWLKDDKDGNKLKVVLADYAAGNEEIRRRDNVTLLVGTILITSSFLILGNVMLKQELPTSVFSLASIGLFSIWLLVLHETGKKINKIAYDHLKSIEAALTLHFTGQDKELMYTFGTHSIVCDKTGDQSAWWLRVRRMFWAFVLLLLSIAWLLLSLSLKVV